MQTELQPETRKQEHWLQTADVNFVMFVRMSMVEQCTGWGGQKNWTADVNLAVLDSRAMHRLAGRTSCQKGQGLIAEGRVGVGGEGGGRMEGVNCVHLGQA